jgi:nucleotide-binding universal stress UspA family protein
MFKRILVAVDLTEQSRTALSLTRQLAIETGASAIALYVVPMPPAIRPVAGPAFRADLATYRSVVERQLTDARRRLEAEVKVSRLDPRATRCVTRAGLPSQKIAEVADELGADLIVVGRGTNGRLGPVAEHTVRLAGKTVMVAPVPRKRRATRSLPSHTRRLRARA